MTASSLPLLTSIFHAAAATPGEITAATELARLTGASVAATASAPPRGILVALASRNLVARIPAAPASPSVYASSEPAWTWIRIAASDSESAGATGEIIATHGAFLFAAVRLLANGVGAFTREKLAAGILLPASFGWHRPHWDACYTQYWRSARGFDPERYVAALAEADPRLHGQLALAVGRSLSDRLRRANSEIQALSR